MIKAWDDLSDKEQVSILRHVGEVGGMPEGLLHVFCDGIDEGASAIADAARLELDRRAALDA